MWDPSTIDRRKSDNMARRIRTNGDRFRKGESGVIVWRVGKKGRMEMRVVVSRRSQKVMGFRRLTLWPRGSIPRHRDVRRLQSAPTLKSLVGQSKANFLPSSFHYQGKVARVS